MKHPRAANFAWRCSNGKYLYWFHNHGGRDYENRNPAWLCGGEEVDSPEGKIIRWSQPEIVLYDDDPYVRISYPDLIEEDGQLFLTETQKNTARIHLIEPALLEGLWTQFEPATVASDGLILSLPTETGGMPEQITMPPLLAFTQRDNTLPNYGALQTRQGFTLDLWLCFDDLTPHQIVFDSRGTDGKGVLLRTTEHETLELVLNDGRTAHCWDCDRGMLSAGKRQHIGIIVDGGPHIILFVVDGRLCDGGECRQFGWGRFSPHLYDVNGADTARLAPSLHGQLESFHVYNRALRVSEIIAYAIF
jgi:hypothetical protein